MGKNYLCFVRIGPIPSASPGNNDTERQQLDKEFNLEPPKLRLYELTKKLAAKIAPHISSSLRDLGVIFDKSI